MGVVASRTTAAMGESKIPKTGLELARPISDVPAEPTKASEVAVVDLGEIEVESPKKTQGKCIITLFSQKYDVTEPNSAGKNGDLFDCGGDMTDRYSAKYGNDVSRMQRFLVSTDVSPTPTVAVTPSAVPTVGGGRTTPTPKMERGKEVKDWREFEEDDDEREDSEHRDRYERESEEEGQEIKVEGPEELGD
jgi:hypothetical protein